VIHSLHVARFACFNLQLLFSDMADKESVFRINVSRHVIVCSCHFDCVLQLTIITSYYLPDRLSASCGDVNVNSPDSCATPDLLLIQLNLLS